MITFLINGPTGATPERVFITIIYQTALLWGLSIFKGCAFKRLATHLSTSFFVRHKTLPLHKSVSIRTQISHNIFLRVIFVPCQGIYIFRIEILAIVLKNRSFKFFLYKWQYNGEDKITLASFFIALLCSATATRAVLSSIFHTCAFSCLRARSTATAFGALSEARPFTPLTMDYRNT